MCIYAFSCNKSIQLRYTTRFGSRGLTEITRAGGGLSTVARGVSPLILLPVNSHSDSASSEHTCIFQRCCSRWSSRTGVQLCSGHTCCLQSLTCNLLCGSRRSCSYDGHYGGWIHYGDRWDIRDAGGHDDDSDDDDRPLISRHHHHHERSGLRSTGRRRDPGDRVTMMSLRQTRRQEMKWGVVKKVENEGVFCKKWTFPQRRVHYVRYHIFYFTFYLFGGGGMRTQPTHPLPTGLTTIMYRVVRFLWWICGVSSCGI